MSNSSDRDQYTVGEFIEDVKKNLAWFALTPNPAHKYTVTKRTPSDASKDILDAKMERWEIPTVTYSGPLRGMTEENEDTGPRPRWQRAGKVTDFDKLRSLRNFKVRRRNEEPTTVREVDSGKESKLEGWVEETVQDIIRYTVCLVCQEIEDRNDYRLEEVELKQFHDYCSNLKLSKDHPTVKHTVADFAIYRVCNMELKFWMFAPKVSDAIDAMSLNPTKISDDDAWKKKAGGIQMGQTAQAAIAQVFILTLVLRFASDTVSHPRSPTHCTRKNALRAFFFVSMALYTGSATTMKNQPSRYPKTWTETRRRPRWMTRSDSTHKRTTNWSGH
jgi:hypothetical protein